MYVHMHLNVYTHRESKYSSTSWPKDIDPFDSSDTSSGAPLLQILITVYIYKYVSVLDHAHSPAKKKSSSVEVSHLQLNNLTTHLGYIDGKCYHTWQHHGSYGIYTSTMDNNNQVSSIQLFR